MKKVTLILAALFFQLIAFGQGVNFVEKDFDEVLAKAKQSNKYIFIDFYTNWCAPCKMMDKQVFPQKNVGEYFNSKFISLKINAEKEGIDLAKKYGIKAYPTFVILDKNGGLQHVFAGGILDGKAFINKVENSFDPKKAYGVLKKRYEAGDRSKELQSAYLQALVGTHTENPEPLINTFYNSLNEKDKVSKETLFIYEMFAPLDSEKADFFEDNRVKFREISGKQKVDSILRSKYEAYYGKIISGYSSNTTVQELNAKEKHINSLGISDLKALPVLKSGAKLQLTKTGKENFLNTLNKTAPSLTDNERDIMLYMTMPGLKKILSDEEKKNLLTMVSNDDVKGYIERSLN